MNIEEDKLEKLFESNVPFTAVINEHGQFPTMMLLLIAKTLA